MPEINLKQIIAIVRPYQAEQVLEGLKRAPLEACTVREVKGFGRQKSYFDEYGESEFSLAFLPKVEINLWVDDTRVDETVRRIVEIARTGRMGDGKIMVLPVTTAEQEIDLATVGHTAADNSTTDVSKTDTYEADSSKADGKSPTARRRRK